MTEIKRYKMSPDENGECIPDPGYLRDHRSFKDPRKLIP